MISFVKDTAAPAWRGAFIACLLLAAAVSNCVLWNHGTANFASTTNFSFF